MEPGQVGLQAGVTSGFPAGGPFFLLGLGGDVAVSHKVAPRLDWGIVRRPDGSVDLRDLRLGSQIVLTDAPTFTVRLQPGVVLPTASAAANYYYTDLSTGSVDPTLAAEAVGGSTWLGSVRVSARVPLYDGADRIRQGPFFGADTRLARRIGSVVPFVGASALRQLPSVPVGAAPDFTEVAATGGVVVAPWDTSSLVPHVRVPLYNPNGLSYGLAVGMVFRTIVGGPPDGHEH